MRYLLTLIIGIVLIAGCTQNNDDGLPEENIKGTANSNFLQAKLLVFPFDEEISLTKTVDAADLHLVNLGQDAISGQYRFADNIEGTSASSGWISFYLPYEKGENTLQERILDNEYYGHTSKKKVQYFVEMLYLQSVISISEPFCITPFRKGGDIPTSCKGVFNVQMRNPSIKDVQIRMYDIAKDPEGIYDKSVVEFTLGDTCELVSTLYANNPSYNPETEEYEIVPGDISVSLDNSGLVYDECSWLENPSTEKRKAIICSVDNIPWRNTASDYFDEQEKLIIRAKYGCKLQIDSEEVPLEDPNIEVIA